MNLHSSFPALKLKAIDRLKYSRNRTVFYHMPWQTLPLSKDSTSKGKLISFAGSFNALLRELVAEFTLTDNPANATTSLLISQCHHDDGVLLGSWHKVSFVEGLLCRENQAYFEASGQKVINACLFNVDFCQRFLGYRSKLN